MPPQWTDTHPGGTDRTIDPITAEVTATVAVAAEAVATGGSRCPIRRGSRRHLQHVAQTLRIRAASGGLALIHACSGGPLAEVNIFGS